MTYERFYEITISIDLILIPAVVTIFVLAVTLLGHAIEVAEEQKKKIHIDQKQELEKEIDKAQEELTRMKKGDGELETSPALNNLQNRKKILEEKLRNIHARYQLLTVEQSVIYPLSFLLLSIIATVYAESLFIDRFDLSIQLWIWALILLTIGSHRLLRCLNTIEEITILSKKITDKKIEDISKKAMSEALLTYDESNLPKLSLSFLEEKQPFRFERNSEVAIKLNVSLTQGYIAQNTELYILIPETFELLETKNQSWSQDSKHQKFPNYKTGRTTWQMPLKKGVSYPVNLKIKTPSQVGEFKLGYYLLCDKYNSGPQEFDVIII